MLNLFVFKYFDWNFDDYHGWYMFGADYKGKQEYYSDKSKLKNLNFIIPIKIKYKIKTI